MHTSITLLPFMVTVFIHAIIAGLHRVHCFSSSNHCWVSFSGFSEAYNGVNAKNIERFCEVTHGMLVLIFKSNSISDDICCVSLYGI